MNAYKLNGHAGQLLRTSICRFLDIPNSSIYKVVKDILPGNAIEINDGRKFKITLIEIKDE